MNWHTHIAAMWHVTIGLHKEGRQEISTIVISHIRLLVDNQYFISQN